MNLPGEDRHVNRHPSFLQREGIVRLDVRRGFLGIRNVLAGVVRIGHTGLRIGVVGVVRTTGVVLGIEGLRGIYRFVRVRHERVPVVHVVGDTLDLDVVDVVADSRRVDPRSCARRVGVHPYEVEDLTLDELLHLHGSSGGVAVGGGIVSGSYALVELAVVTEEEIVVSVGGAPIVFNRLVVHVNVLGVDLTANEDVGRVTLAVAAGTTIGCIVSVRVGENEFAVETVGVLHILFHVLEASVVSCVRHNVATAEVVGLVTPETRVVVLVVRSGYVVVRVGIGGNEGAVGRLVLVVRGVRAFLLVEVERAFTLSHNVGEVRDGSERHSVAVGNGFNGGRGGVVTLHFVAVLVGSHEHASHSTLYRNFCTVGSRGGSRKGLRFRHTVGNVHFAEVTGHYDHVLLVSTRTVELCEVVSHSEGIGRTGSCSSLSFGVLGGSGSTGSRLESEHAVVLSCESVEVGLTCEESLRFGVGVYDNEDALLTRINLETLGRTDVRNTVVTGLRLFERDVRGSEGCLLLERVAAGRRCIGLEDVNVYRLDKVGTDPLTYVVVLRVGGVLSVGCGTYTLFGHAELELNRHYRTASGFWFL